MVKERPTKTDQISFANSNRKRTYFFRPADSEWPIPEKHFQPHIFSAVPDTVCFKTRF